MLGGASDDVDVIFHRLTFHSSMSHREVLAQEVGEGALVGRRRGRRGGFGVRNRKRRRELPTASGPERRRHHPASAVRLRRARPLREALLQAGGVEGPRLRTLSRRLSAVALRVRPDHREARPERRPGWTGDDREAAPGRLHHPLQAEPGARRRNGAADRAGPPAPRHVALGALVRQRALLRRWGGEDDRSVPEGLRHAVGATDQWQLLYMVHSAIAQTDVVYITYDIDFVPADKAEKLGIKPAYPVWLDVRPSGYPVFNAQRDFGGNDGTCTWPRQKCAAFDPWGKEFTGQGKPGNKQGTDLSLPDRGESLGRIQSFTGGTLIGIGGHVHPGGLENRINLVRGDKSTRIYTGKAAYWNRKHPGRPGGPPTSWDFSMRVTGLPKWGVRVKPGDRLRSNATYDTKIQSTYENMGIAVALLAPDRPDGSHTAKGVNPFKAKKDRSPKCRSGGLENRPRTLCDKGIVTHGHLPESDNFGGPAGGWDARTGPGTGLVGIANFLYEPGDLSTISMTGLPTVKLGSDLRFANTEGGAIYTR